MRNKIQRGVLALLAAVTLVTAGATPTVAQPDTPPSGDIGTQVVGGGQAAHCVTNLSTAVSQTKARMFSLRLNGSPTWIPVQAKDYQVRTGSRDRAWINAVRTGQIDSTLPLTAEQGGPIPHPSIKFTTTEKIQPPNQASVR